MNLKNYLLILLGTLFTLNNATPMHVTFDMGGVVMVTHGFAAAKEVGLGHFANFGIRNFSKILVLGDHIQYQILYRFLDSLESHNTTVSYDPNGKRIPNIMCDRFRGAITCDELLLKIEDALETNDRSIAEKRLLREMTAMMFTPARFVNTQVLVPGIYELVQHCIRNGDVVSIHSVWDKESFALLKQKYPEFFALFDDKNIFISGDTHLLKPDPASYEYVLTALGLHHEPWHNTFVDDLVANTNAAAQLGIHTIVCTKKPRSLFAQSGPDLATVKKQIDARRIELIRRDFDEAAFENKISNHQYAH